MSKTRKAVIARMDKNAPKKSQHSNYWLDKSVWDDDDSTAVDNNVSRLQASDTDNMSRLFRLAAIRRGIANFVQIMTNKNVPVEFSSGTNSYTDGKTVVISADDDQTKFDPMVGLALHEASHVLLSDFEFLLQWSNLRNNVSTGWHPREFGGMTVQENGHSALEYIMPPSLVPLVANPTQENWATRTIRILDDIKDIMNILEDRRIDKFVYTTAAGYRPYYDALYNKYFYTEEIGKNLKYNPEWREPTVENYINRLLFAFHPDADPNALAGLPALVKMMDLPNIDRVGEIPKNEKGIPLWREVAELRKGTNTPKIYFEPEAGSAFNRTPVLWQEACNLYAYILKFAALNAERKEQQNVTGTAAPTDMVKDSTKDLPNLDGMPSEPKEMEPTEPQTNSKGKAGAFNEKKAKKEIEAARNIIKGTSKKKKLSASDTEAVKSIEQASADIVDIQGEGVPFGKCIVTRRITDTMIDQDWFIFGCSNRGKWWGQQIDPAISLGKRMGAILLQRLQVRNDPLVTKQTRLMQGGIDRRLLSQLGMDIESVFHKNRVDQHRPAMLHLTLDASGSMAGAKWFKVVTVAVALAMVGSKMRNVDTVISVRGGNDIPMVSILYDSRKDQFPTFLRYIRKIGPAGSTPEGLCFKATMDLILESANTHDVYFINFSDGEPSFSYTKTGIMGKRTDDYYSNSFGYYGEVATTHTRKQIQNLRDHGVKVLSYFISERPLNLNYTIGPSMFRAMYGESASFVDVNNATEVVRTLNKLLLARGA